MPKNDHLDRLYNLLDRIYLGELAGHRPVEESVASDQLAAYIVWMSDEPMIPERTYSIRFANKLISVQITDLSYKIEVDTLSRLAAKTLNLDEVGYCKLALGQSIVFDSYRDNQKTGSFTLIDELTNSTIGAGVVDFSLRRAQNISWQKTSINKELRSHAKQQKPCVLWFTGLSGSGKSTIADELEKKLHQLGKHSILLDGDNVRHGLNKDLGFTDQDRVENIRRIAEVSKLMVSSGLITIVSFISPFQSERVMARNLLDEGEFIEIYIDTPIEICEARDPKGLYKKARAGKLKNFTGIDSEYEVPEKVEITLRNSKANIDDLVGEILEYLTKNEKI
jgi:bifunctional enzyme CysN/CysC